MKNLKILGLVAGFIALAAFIVVGAWKLGGHFENKKEAADKAKFAICAQKGQEHIVVVKDNKANPKHTDGKQCDTLTITNEQDTGILLAFGVHDHHQPYDGVTERELRKRQSVTVTLNEIGTFEFHDHISDIMKGDFTVSK